jgi:hypothetical protein
MSAVGGYEQICIIKGSNKYTLHNALVEKINDISNLVYD